MPSALCESADKRDNDFWVFGYGSLMWRPGFVFNARSKAVISGWRRRLCVYSHVYRGTAERPGLVLGLDNGGECAGVAFHVDARLREQTVRYLRERELVTAVYLETAVTAKLENGETINALAYVADRRHPQYAAPMTRHRLLKLIKQGVGRSGDNAEYVLNTRDHLHAIGIRDPELEWLADRLREG
jgi:glutathione-specific gamma-glutamylcyclotransferase